MRFPVSHSIVISHPDFQPLEMYLVEVPAGSVMNAQQILNARITWSFTTKMFVGVAEVQSPAPMIYPNPATDKVNIANLKENQDIFIHDILGNLLLEFPGDRDMLDLSSLRPGIYVISVKNGQETHTEKLIVR